MNFIVFSVVVWLALLIAVYYWLKFSNNKRVYLVCPVRNISADQQLEIEKYVRGLELNGYTVHYPPRDVDQNDPTGIDIVLAHRQAMKKCNRVDIFWDVNSKGSHFDLGMAVVLGKKIRLVKAYQEDTDGKSFLKVIQELHNRNY